ncbi:lantibiotic dehydratase family protein [Neorhizobium galegae]|uniref:lantibiotic dehydratase family protein n=1 Tax=Neorhizobium galegae TaxID=399 RepID=UPI001F163EA1|nr:lantibiotic dehydratase family protein [Neorhizobium galegae]UIK06600.1 lantibiotic dehydratase family protein [Neorhizobium galegae]
MRNKATVVLAPYFIQRRAIIRGSSFESIFETEFHSELIKLSGLEHRITDAAAGLADAIFKRVRGEQDTDLRRRLLAAKRGIHNHAAVSIESLDIETTLSSGMRSWNMLLETRDALHAEVAALYSACIASVGYRAYELSKSFPLQRSLRVLNPRLADAKVSSLLGKNGLSRIGLSLVSYAVRGLTKADPFAGLGHITVGTFPDVQSIHSPRRCGATLDQSRAICCEEGQANANNSLWIVNPTIEIQPETGEARYFDTEWHTGDDALNTMYLPEIWRLLLQSVLAPLGPSDYLKIKRQVAMVLSLQDSDADYLIARLEKLGLLIRCDGHLPNSSAFEYQHLGAIHANNSCAKGGMTTERDIVPPPSEFMPICNILHLFNYQMAWIDSVSEFFLSRWGENGETGLLQFFEEFWQHSKINNALLTFESETHGYKEMKRQRGELISKLASILEVECGQEVSVSELFQNYAAERPGAAVMRSSAFSGHILDRRFILDRVLPGYGAMFARWSSDDHGPNSASELLRLLRTNLVNQQGSNEFIELVGSFGFEPQVNPRVTARRLIHPSDLKRTGADPNIKFGDVRVVFDEREHRVFMMDRLSGKYLVPIPMGTIGPQHTPPLYRFLCAIGTAFCPELPLLEHLEARMPPLAHQQVRRYPRLTVGPIVVMRSSSCVATVELCSILQLNNPVLRAKELLKWLDERRLPSQCFVRSLLAHSAPNRRTASAHKPLFVNWQNPASVELLRKHIGRMGAEISITESLPTLSKESEPVTETIVELFW